MPFVYDETDIEWPDDDSDPPRPAANQFVFIPPAEFGGSREPVRFANPPHDTTNEDQRLLAIMLPVLRGIGLRRIYSRYDGGNDEGFTWLDRAGMENGEWIDAQSLIQKLLDLQVLDKLSAVVTRSADLSDREHLKYVLDLWLCHDWASLLLGRGFGTGEYSMFGAFTVDLDTREITDDPNADPVVKNIGLAE